MSVKTGREFYATRPYPKLFIYNWEIFGRWQKADVRRDWAEYLYLNEKARRDYDIRTNRTPRTEVLAAYNARRREQRAAQPKPKPPSPETFKKARVQYLTKKRVRELLSG